MAIAASPYPPTPYLRGVAAKLRERPGAVIAQALDTLARWRSQGQSAAHRLDEWERLLRAALPDGSGGGLAALLHALESGDDPAAARLRDFHPFPGMLTREERRALRGPCAYRH